METLKNAWNSFVEWNRSGRAWWLHAVLAVMFVLFAWTDADRSAVLVVFDLVIAAMATFNAYTGYKRLHG